MNFVESWKFTNRYTKAMMSSQHNITLEYKPPYIKLIISTDYKVIINRTTGGDDGIRTNIN